MQQNHSARQSDLTFGGRSDAAGVLVIDTNVILDLLVFADPRSHRLASRLAACADRWHATDAMRLEFEAVLLRPKFARFGAKRLDVMDRWRTWTRMVEPVGPAPTGLPCRDPDDQKFLDLALQLSPSCLLTRDNEILRLVRPAEKLGVRITTPERYCGPMKKGGPSDRPWI